MKTLDELFGPLICFLLYWFNVIKGVFSPDREVGNPEDVRHIVILKFFGMGSIILAGPLFRALKHRFPEAKIILLTFAGNREIASRIPDIDEVVTVDTKSLVKFACSMLKALRHIRRLRCEISLDLEFFAKSSTIVQYLCGSRARVGYYLMQMGFLIRMMWRGNLLTHNVYYNPHRHVSEAFLALGRCVGADTDDMRPAMVSLGTAEENLLRGVLQENGIGDRDDLVVLNINASELCVERRWPQEYFVELTNRLLDRHQIRVVLIGQKEDVPYVRSFVERMQRRERLTDLTGKLDIGMLAVLLKKAEVFITNDSGPLHLAVSVGTPTVSFFGPEIPERFGHGGDRHAAFYAGVYCSPCLNVFNQKTAPCHGNNICMKKISVDEVDPVIDARFLNGSFSPNAR